MVVNDQQGFIMRWFLVLQAASDNYRKRLLTSGYCLGVIVHVHSQRCFAVMPIQGLHKDSVMAPERPSHPRKCGRGEAQAGDPALISQYPRACSLCWYRQEWRWRTISANQMLLQTQLCWEAGQQGQLCSGVPSWGWAASFVTSALPLWQCGRLLLRCHGVEGPFPLSMFQGHSTSAVLSAKNCWHLSNSLESGHYFELPKCTV